MFIMSPVLPPAPQVGTKNPFPMLEKTLWNLLADTAVFAGMQTAR